MAKQPEARQTRTQAAFASALGALLQLLQPWWAALERSVRAAPQDALLLLWLDLQLQVSLSAAHAPDAIDHARLHEPCAPEAYITSIPDQLLQPWWATLERSVRTAPPDALLLLGLDLLSGHCR